MAPWKGPRHRSWASDTWITSVAAGVVIITYMVWEAISTAPQGMVTLVGLAGGALFGAVSGDKKKRTAETEAQVDSNRQKVNRLERVTEREHDETMRALDPDDDDDAPATQGVRS